MRDVVVRTWGKWDPEWQRSRLLSRLDLERVQLIQRKGADVGMLETQSEPALLHIINVQVLPEFQRLGIGSLAIKQAIDEARLSGRGARLQVLRHNNDAIRLYQRLGFSTIDHTDTHSVMELA
ncbi:GNAT family N-acetyltransferase [Lysobacter soli]|uniref:GNAT family N-acetyltransferase n=1 Tax=Lysobacter soli TaxID=453783 RepID=UPI00240EFD44|nr:GNAT family N-acetyltransferase [Lysobacter soli]